MFPYEDSEIVSVCLPVHRYPPKKETNLASSILVLQYLVRSINCIKTQKFDLKKSLKLNYELYFDLLSCLLVLQ